MSIVIRRVPILTDSSGDDVSTVLIKGRLAKVTLELGSLTTPDLTITDEPAGTTLLADAGVASDTDYYPSVVMCDDAGAPVAGFSEPIVFGRLQVTIAGGGATKAGAVALAIER